MIRTAVILAAVLAIAANAQTVTVQDLGSLGGAAHETKLGRIDVDHVDVTTPTGTVEAREGIYRIESDGMGMFQDRKFKTGTGVDVPPGTYRVVVSYPANSGWKEFTQTVTTP